VGNYDPGEPGQQIFAHECGLETVDGLLRILAVAVGT